MLFRPLTTSNPKNIMQNTPEKPTPPDILSGEIKERFLRSRFAPKHIQTSPNEWGVIWMGGNEFLFFREFNYQQ